MLLPTPKKKRLSLADRIALDRNVRQEELDWEKQLLKDIQTPLPPHKKEGSNLPSDQTPITPDKPPQTKSETSLSHPDDTSPRELIPDIRYQLTRYPISDIRYRVY
jgi:hypothetical protein